MVGAASGAGQAVVGGRNRESAKSAKAAARGRNKAGVGPEASAVRKRRRAGSVTDGGTPAAGPWVSRLVRGARLDLAGVGDARVGGRVGESREAMPGSEERARQVGLRRQAAGQGMGDQEPPVKKAHGHAAGASREVRSSIDPGD